MNTKSIEEFAKEMVYAVMGSETRSKAREEVERITESMIDSMVSSGYLHTPSAKEEEKPVSNKDTHDLVISSMAPSYCRRCDKSGSELSANPCKGSETSNW